jgi:hypothetical protein
VTEGNGHRDEVGAAGFGPFRALSTLSSVQRAGLDAAGQVIDRLLDLLPGETSVAPEASGAPEAPDAEPHRAGASAVPELRRSVARALDLYSDLVRRSFENYADLVEQTLRVRGVQLHAREDPQVGPLVVVAVPGQQASGTVWLHNSTATSASARLLLTDLTAHDGTVVPGTAGRFLPAQVSVAPGGRASAELVLVVDGAAPGTYRGHILARGLPDAALPIQVSVTGGPPP